MGSIKRGKLLQKNSFPFLMKGNRIVGLNVKLHWTVMSKLKNAYKKRIKDWNIKKENIPKEIHFDWYPVYKNKIRRDAINIARTIKIIEDCFVELKLLEDDNLTTHTIHLAKVDKKLKRHKLDFEIHTRL